MWNQFKTMILLASITGVLVVVGGGLAERSGTSHPRLAGRSRPWPETTPITSKRLARCIYLCYFMVPSVFHVILECRDFVEFRRISIRIPLRLREIEEILRNLHGRQCITAYSH